MSKSNQLHSYELIWKNNIYEQLRGSLLIFLTLTSTSVFRLKITKHVLTTFNYISGYYCKYCNTLIEYINGIKILNSSALLRKFGKICKIDQFSWS
jgi:hypothetical protein